MKDILVDNVEDLFIEEDRVAIVKFSNVITTDVIFLTNGKTDGPIDVLDHLDEFEVIIDSLIAGGNKY